MRSSRPQFEQFLRRVRRRFITLRLAELSGLGLLAGCAAGLPLVIVSICLSVSPSPLAVGALVLGTVAGFFYGLLYRPTLQDTAAESDRQLGTSDLLSTALGLRESDDPWAGAVLATADSWARAADPSSVILNRLGARAWGGIGLATALLGVLTLLPAYASPIHAADHAANQTGVEAGSEQSAFSSAKNSRRSVPEQQPEDPGLNRDRPDQAARRARGMADAVVKGGNRESGTKPGGGRGESHTTTSARKDPRSFDATEAKGGGVEGRPADGAGKSTQGAVPGGNNSSQLTGVSPAPAPVPWKSDAWSGEARQALGAVDSGQVPDSYRDVMQSYFDRR